MSYADPRAIPDRLAGPCAATHDQETRPSMAHDTRAAVRPAPPPVRSSGDLGPDAGGC